MLDQLLLDIAKNEAVVTDKQSLHNVLVRNQEFKDIITQQSANWHKAIDVGALAASEQGVAALTEILNGIISSIEHTKVERMIPPIEDYRICYAHLNPMSWAKFTAQHPVLAEKFKHLHPDDECFFVIFDNCAWMYDLEAMAIHPSGQRLYYPYHSESLG